MPLNALDFAAMFSSGAVDSNEMVALRISNIALSVVSAWLTIINANAIQYVKMLLIEMRLHQK
jgi:hypothetical protein